MDFEIVEDSGVYLFGAYNRAVRQFYIDDHKNRHYLGPDNRRLFCEIDRRLSATCKWSSPSSMRRMRRASSSSGPARPNKPRLCYTRPIVPISRAWISG